MFVIYVQMLDPSVRKMSTIVSGAIYMVATGYGIMGLFGYLIFVEDGVKGDILTNFPHDGVSQIFRLGKYSPIYWVEHRGLCVLSSSCTHAHTHTHTHTRFLSVSGCQFSFDNVSSSSKHLFSVVF